MEKLEKINEILDNYIEILTIHHLDCVKLFEVKQIITDYYELVEYLQFVKELYGSSEDEKLTKRAKELKKAINILWPHLLLHTKLKERE